MRKLLNDRDGMEKEKVTTATKRVYSRAFQDDDSNNNGAKRSDEMVPINGR